MKHDDTSLEARLRRTLSTLAETPLELEAAAGRPPVARRPVRVALAAAAVVALVLTALAVLPDRSETVSATGRDRAAGAPGDDRSGAPPTLADYRLTREEATTLFRADQRATRRCMEAAGQRYEEASPDAFADLDRHWSRLGRTDRDRASRLGYVVEHGPGGRHPSQGRLRTDAERDAWSQALTGQDHNGSSPDTAPSVPVVHPETGEENGRQGAGGCFGQVQRDLYGDQSRHTSLESFIANDLRARVEESVIADPRLRDGIRAWSECMKRRGHDYEKPHDPISRFGTDAAPGRPTADERRIALDDIACKDAVRLVAIYDDLEAEHGRPVAKEYEKYLREYRAIVERALARAEEILATP